MQRTSHSSKPATPAASAALIMMLVLAGFTTFSFAPPEAAAAGSSGEYYKADDPMFGYALAQTTGGETTLHRSVGLGTPDRNNHQWSEDDLGDAWYGAPEFLHSAPTANPFNHDDFQEPPLITYHSWPGPVTQALYSDEPGYAKVGVRHDDVVATTMVGAASTSWHVMLYRESGKTVYWLRAIEYNGHDVVQTIEQRTNVNDDQHVLDIEATMADPDADSGSRSEPSVAMLYTESLSGSSWVYMRIQEMQDGGAPYDRGFSIRSGVSAEPTWAGNLEDAGFGHFLVELQEGSSWATKVIAAGWAGRSPTTQEMTCPQGARYGPPSAGALPELAKNTPTRSEIHGQCIWTVSDDLVDISRFKFYQYANLHAPSFTHGYAGSHFIPSGLPSRADIVHLALHTDHYKEHDVYFDDDSGVFTIRDIDQYVALVAGVAKMEVQGGYATLGFDGMGSKGTDKRTQQYYDYEAGEPKTHPTTDILNDETPVGITWRSFQTTDPADDTFASTELPAFRPGMQIRHTDESYIKLSEGIPIAYLVAPPVVEGLGQSGNTAVSEQSTTATTAGSTIAARAGAFITGGGKIPVVQVEVEATARVGYEYQHETSVSESISLGNGAHTDPTQDAVLMLQERLRYRDVTVLKSSYSDEETTITLRSWVPGSVMAIRPVSELDGGINGVHFDFSEIQTHTPGDPGSYPDLAGAQDPCIFHVGHSPTLIGATVGGSTSQDASIGFSSETAESHSHTGSLDITIQATISGVGGGIDGGFSIGANNGFSAGEALEFVGHVGNLPDGTPASEEYNWGLNVCQTAIPATVGGATKLHDVWVANYFVDEYDGAGPIGDAPAVQGLEPLVGTDRSSVVTFEWSTQNHQHVDYRLEVEALGNAPSHTETRAGGVGTDGWQTFSVPIDLSDGAGIPHRWRVTNLMPDGTEGESTGWRSFTPWAEIETPEERRTHTILPDGTAMFFLNRADPSIVETHMDVKDAESESMVESVTFGRNEPIATQPLAPGDYEVSFWHDNPAEHSPTFTKTITVVAPSGGGSEDGGGTVTADPTIAPDAYFVESGQYFSVQAEDIGEGGSVDYDSHPYAASQFDLGETGHALRFDRPGYYDLTATHTDADGNTTPLTTSVTVLNNDPVVSVNVDRVVDFGEPVFYSIRADDEYEAGMDLTDPFNPALLYDTTYTSGTFTPDEAGLDEFCAWAFDDQGGSAKECVQIEVRNPPPTVDAGPDAALEPGESFQFDAVIEDDRGVETLVADYGNGDGGVNTDLAFGTLYDEPGNHLACLRAYDAQGAAAEDCVTITMANRAPDVRLSSHSGGTIRIGEPSTFSADAWDHDGWITEIAIDDNATGSAIGSTRTITPSELKPLEVCATATDGQGDTGTDCLTVEVVAPIPSIHASGPESELSLTDVTFHAEAVDARGDPVAEVFWVVDGDRAAEGADATFHFGTPGLVEVCAVAVDQYEAAAMDCLLHEVINRPPDLSAFASAEDVMTDEDVTFYADAVDPEGEGVSWYWYHDGASVQFGGDLTIAFDGCGHEEVEVWAVDIHDSWASVTVPIHVWTAFLASPPVSMDRISGGDGVILLLDQPIPSVYVPSVRAGVCADHSPMIVVGEHDHGEAP